MNSIQRNAVKTTAVIYFAVKSLCAGDLFRRLFAEMHRTTVSVSGRNPVSRGETFFGKLYFVFVLWEPLLLSYQHFVNHLPDFRRIADGAGERVH